MKKTNNNNEYKKRERENVVWYPREKNRKCNVEDDVEEEEIREERVDCFLVARWPSVFHSLRIVFVFTEGIKPVCIRD